MEIEVAILNLVNKQFEMIGESMRFEDIPEDGMITVGKKKMMWYEHFKLSENQEAEWSAWMRRCIKGSYLSKKGDCIEMRYGFIRKLDKEKGPV